MRMYWFPRLRKFVLTIHITTSVGWIGSVVAYVALVIAAMTNQDVQILALRLDRHALDGMVCGRPTQPDLAHHRTYHVTWNQVGFIPALLGFVLARADCFCQCYFASTYANGECASSYRRRNE